MHLYILSKVQTYTLLYVGYWLKETFLKCLNYWGYGRSPNLHPSAIVRPRLTKWSTIVVLISSDMLLCPWSLQPLPLFCHFHASFLLFFLSSADPDRFLDVHPSSEFFTFVLSSVYICFQLKVHEMHLWAISDNWFIIGWSTFSQDSLAQFMSNL